MQRGALHDVVSPSQITVNSLNIRKHNVVLNLAAYETSCGCFDVFRAPLECCNVRVVCTPLSEKVVENCT